MSWHRKQFRPLKPIPRWEQPRDPCKPQGCVGVDRPFAWAKLKMQAVCRFSYAPQKQHFNDCSYCIDEIRRINTSERAKLSSFLDIFCAVFCWTAWCTRNNNQKVHSKLHLQKRVKMRSRPASFFPLRGSGFQAGRRLRYVTTTADTFSKPPPEKKVHPKLCSRRHEEGKPVLAALTSCGMRNVTLRRTISLLFPQGFCVPSQE